MNTKQTAIQKLKSFFLSADKFLLVNGTHQSQKLPLVLETARRYISQPSKILLRINDASNTRAFLRPLRIPVRRNPGMFFPFGSHRLYTDTYMRVSWRNTPTPVDIAIVYPLGSLPASKESVWFRDILDRGATKICLVTWIDKEDVSWVNGSNPVRVTYDDDREDHHWNTLNMEHRCRVIQILCDHCGRYWGQLNQPHPGDSTIRNAKTGEYRANCLKCAMETTKFYFRFPA